VVDAYPKDTVPAHVDHVAYEAETVNNVTVYHVDVLPEAVPDFMRSGMTATVTFTVAGTDDALVVPTDAVRRDGGETFVLVPGGSWNKSDRRPVTTGMTDGKLIQITEGLNDGDAVLAPSLKLPKAVRAPRSNPLAPQRGRPRAGQGRQP
jgi:macrolide-specific efflux system membrane fusion protein